MYTSDEDGATTQIDAQAAADGASATVTLSRSREATELRVRRISLAAWQRLC